MIFCFESVEACTKLATDLVQNIYQVVESGGKNLEVAVMRKEGLHQLEESEIDAIVAEIEAEKAAAEAAKKGPASS